MGGNRAGDLVALDDAMNALARLDPRKARVVEMRFFGGLNVEEIADVLQGLDHCDARLDIGQGVALSRARGPTANGQ